jgi:tetratricopeptide (TPR) repeat protein
MTERDVQRYAGRGPLHTDDRPRLEFSAPKSSSDVLTWQQNISGIAAAARSAPGSADSVLARYMRADSLVLQGITAHFDDQARAIRAYQTALRINPADRTIEPLITDAEQRFFGPMLYEAQQCERNGQLTCAAELYAKILATDPGRRDVLARMAITLAGCGLLDSAVALVTNGLHADPRWIDGFKTLGVIFVRSKLFEKAIPALDTALMLDPRLAEAYSTRAIAFAGKGMFPRALEDLDKAITLAPDEPTPYENRAYMYRKTGHADLASRDESKAAECRKLRADGNAGW